MRRGLFVTALSLAVLCLSGCTDEARKPSEVATDDTSQSRPEAAPSAPTEDYCVLYAQLEEEQLDGSPYDPETYAEAVRQAESLAEAGPAELSDEWAVVVNGFRGMEAAAASVDLAGVSAAEAYMVIAAEMGDGPWPAGVDRKQVATFDRAVAQLDLAAAGEADDTISETTRELCGEPE